jgi:hypothetical protein
MACKNSCNGFARVNSAAAYVDQVVAIERQRGTKVSAALDIAADALGLPARKVYSHHYQQPVTLPAACRAVRARFTAWLAADIARSEQIIAQRRALLAEMMGEPNADALGEGAGDARLDVVAGVVEE